MIFAFVVFDEVCGDVFYVVDSFKEEGLLPQRSSCLDSRGSCGGGGGGLCEEIGIIFKDLSNSLCGFNSILF